MLCRRGDGPPWAGLRGPRGPHGAQSPGPDAGGPGDALLLLLPVAFRRGHPGGDGVRQEHPGLRGSGSERPGAPCVNACVWFHAFL